MFDWEFEVTIAQGSHAASQYAAGSTPWFSTIGELISSSHQTTSGIRHFPEGGILLKFLGSLLLGHGSTLFESKPSAHFTNSRIFKPLPREFSTRNVGASFPRERELADWTLRSPLGLLWRQIGCVECGRSRRGASQRLNSGIPASQGCELTLWWPLTVQGRKPSPGHAIVGIPKSANYGCFKSRT